MIVFATSDPHGNKIIMEKLSRAAAKADLLLICGDIGSNDAGGKTLMQFSEHQKADAVYLSDVFSRLPVPARFILGNDDWFDMEDNPYYLAQPEQIQDIRLIPFEYVLYTPFNTNREVNENKLGYELHKLKADTRSVIVAHTPPHGCGDLLYNASHCGSKAVRAWIEETEPLVWLCGHVHEANSAHLIGSTYVFNCACYHSGDRLRGWLIDTDTMTYERMEV